MMGLQLTENLMVQTLGPQSFVQKPSIYCSTQPCWRASCLQSWFTSKHNGKDLFYMGTDFCYLSFYQRYWQVLFSDFNQILSTKFDPSNCKCWFCKAITLTILQDILCLLTTSENAIPKDILWDTCTRKQLFGQLFNTFKFKVQKNREKVGMRHTKRVTSLVFFFS